MGWKISGTDLSIFGSYKAVAYVRDDGTVVDTDVWSPKELCKINNDGRIMEITNSIFNAAIFGQIRSDGGVEDSKGRIAFWIHSNGDICDSYESDTSWVVRTLGHVEQDGNATGILGQIISNKQESSYSSSYSSNSNSNSSYSLSSDSSSEPLYNSSYGIGYGSSYISNYSSGYSSDYSSSYSSSIVGGNYSYSGPGSKWSYFSKSSEDIKNVTSNNITKTTLEEHPEKAWLITAIVFSLLTLLDLISGSSGFIPFESIVTIIAWLVFIIKIYKD